MRCSVCEADRAGQREWRKAQGAANNRQWLRRKLQEKEPDYYALLRVVAASIEEELKAKP